MKLNPWPYAIIAYFVVFITGVVTWVTFAMRNEDQLVRKDYYDHEIKYQKQIERESRAASVKADIQVSYLPEAQTLRIALPGKQTKIDKAQLHLYRPSNSKLDKVLPLNLGETASQTLSVADLQNGFWKARVSWTASGVEYYFEKPLMLETGKE